MFSILLGLVTLMVCFLVLLLPSRIFFTCLFLLYGPHLFSTMAPHLKVIQFGLLFSIGCISYLTPKIILLYFSMACHLTWQALGKCLFNKGISIRTTALNGLPPVAQW